ncbi:MAG: hypothetical protein JGK33_09155 [Microcoleus sp. PH2017_11_PCY_U_A]|uniref:hypothetical protein n=1 Tax=unclassified Microcoleus TaxID=2642155 RepID=UPI001D8B6055|nr:MULTISPECIES: hypothetical protein [unclassified Microcoleus]MCC3459826.1 hypothetical protein [Microcoleus sp. PH2017_11_PCY_U_A]MCC3478259.1 hypothetical protein [Microcoleus sp. PH2017_12_PCY_D_A]
MVGIDLLLLGEDIVNEILIQQQNRQAQQTKLFLLFLLNLPTIKLSHEIGDMEVLMLC